MDLARQYRFQISDSLGLGIQFWPVSEPHIPTQIPVSRFQGQFPVDLAHQYRFQISGSKGWSGSQIRRKHNPGSSIQITEYREDGEGGVAGGDYRYIFADSGEGGEGQGQKSRVQIPGYGLH